MTGEQLKAIREARGETQDQFGKRVGRTGSAISLYESGLRKVDRSVAMLARKLRRPSISITRETQEG